MASNDQSRVRPLDTTGRLVFMAIAAMLVSSALAKGSEWCSDRAILDEVQRVTGDALTTPDMVVDLEARPRCGVVDPDMIGTGGPATCSIQAALDWIAEHGDPSPGDDVVFVAVRSSDGSDSITTANIKIPHPGPEQLIVAGCRVGLRPADPALPVIEIGAGAGEITVTGVDVSGGDGPGYRVAGPSNRVELTAFTAEDNGIGLAVEDAGAAVTVSGAIISNSRGDAVRVETSAGLSMTDVRIVDPTGFGVRATDLTGAVVFDTVRISGIDSADTSGIAVTNTMSGPTEITIASGDFSSSATGSSFLAFSAGGNTRMTVVIEEESRFSGLFGEALQIAAGGSPDSTAVVTAIVRDATFDNAAANGLSGIALSAAARSTLEFRLEGNTLRDLGRPGMNSGVINIQTFDGGRADGSISGNTIVSTSRRALHIATENDAPAASRVVIAGNEIDDIAREALYLSSRESTSELVVIVRDNLIGTTAPVGTSGREAIEVQARDTAKLVLSITGNRIVNTGDGAGDETVDISSSGQAEIHATVRDNSMTNSGSHPQAVFRAATRDSGSMCLSIAGNTAEEPGVFDLRAESGHFELVGLTGVAAENSGTVSISSSIRAAGRDGCDVPD